MTFGFEPVLIVFQFQVIISADMNWNTRLQSSLRLLQGDGWKYALILFSAGIMTWTVRQNWPWPQTPPKMAEWVKLHAIWDSRPLEIDHQLLAGCVCTFAGQELFDQVVNLHEREINVQFVAEQSAESQAVGERITFFQLIFDPAGKPMTNQGGFDCLVGSPFHGQLKLPRGVQKPHEYIVRIYAKVESPNDYNQLIKEIPYRYVLIGRGTIRMLE